MKRKEFKILVGSWISRLEREIDLVRDELPENSERTLKEHFIGPEDERPTAFSMVSILGKRKEENYEQRPTGDFTILHGLRNSVDDLKEAINILEEK